MEGFKKKTEICDVMFFCSSDMDQLSDKPKETAGNNSNKSDSGFAQETFSEGVLTRNRTSNIAKSPAVPRPRTRSLSGSSQSDILTPESEKQSPGQAPLLKRASVPAKSDQVANELPAKGGRRRRRTKAQIAADNVAKQTLLELEKKETGLPIAKKPGRPRGRPKKVRTPVETPSSTVTNSPTSSTQNEEPLPSLNVSNQELLESLTGEQEAAKSSNDNELESSCDFDISTEQNSNVSSLPSNVSMTLLKGDELTFKEDTPLLKEDTGSPPVVEETKAAHSSYDKEVMVVVEEQSTEECEKATTKTTEKSPIPDDTVKQQDNSSQPVACPDSISPMDTTDSGPTKQPVGKSVEKSSEPMDISPDKATPTIAEVPLEKIQSSSVNTATSDSVKTAEETSSNLPTDNDELMDIKSTAITTSTTAQETSAQNCSTESSATTAVLTGAEPIVVDSSLTTCSAATVSSSANAAMPIVSLKPSSTGAGTLSNTTTKTVTSSVSSLNASSATTTTVNSTQTTTSSSGALKDVPFSHNATSTVKSASFVSLSSSAAVNSTSYTKTVMSFGVSASQTTTTNSTIGLATSSVGSTVANTIITKSVASTVSVIELSSSTTGVNNSIKNIASTISSLIASPVATASLATQSVQSQPSMTPSISLAPSTTPSSRSTTVSSSASSKTSSQTPMLLSSSFSTAISSNNVSVASTAKSSGPPTTSIDVTRDVAKLDPLPINLNTSLSVTLPTLSSLLTTPSGQQKLVLPLEKLVLPSSLETSAATTGSFMSSPPISKPSHSCSYVITSMQTKDADPVSLAVSTLSQTTKENNNMHSIASQKVTSTTHPPIISSVAPLESKRSESTNVESKLREIAPKTLGLEFHHLTSGSSGAKKPELYEVLSSFKVVNRSVGSSESKSSSFTTSTTAGGIVGQGSSSKEKLFDQSSSGQVVSADKEQHKQRPIAIKPDGMDLLRQIPAAVATSSRTYPTVHPLFPLPAGNKTGNLMTSFDLFRSVPTTQKQYSTTTNISASVLPHLPGSSIAAYPTQKAPPPLISITDGPSQTVLGSVRVKVIDNQTTAPHQSLSSLPSHMKVSRSRPLTSQQSSVSAPIVTTTLVSVTGTVPAPPTGYSNVSQQQFMPHPLTIGVHASTSNKVLSSSDVAGVSWYILIHASIYNICCIM